MSVQLIVTADDFGKSVSVNRAVEASSLRGILTNASLMVTGDAFNDALLRLEKLKGLQVGLHLALTEHGPASPETKSLFLVNKKGHFNGSMFGMGIALKFIKRVQKQVAMEVNSQFRAFADTGLPFTHVDCHHHFHIHPMLFDILLENALKFNVKRIRIPYEPWDISESICKGNRVRNYFYRKVFEPLSKNCRTKLGKTGIKTTDGVFGLYATGELSKDWVVMLIDKIKTISGTYELYTHPDDNSSGAGRVEFDMLTCQSVKKELYENGIRVVAA